MTANLISVDYQILLALASGDKHGYAIMQAVEESSRHATRLGPGTLYGAIKRLLEQGLIDESSERPDPELDDQRRRYYRLTASGRVTVAEDTRRLESLLRFARRQRATS